METIPSSTSQALRSFKKWSLITVVGALVLALLYTWLSLSFSYSDGDRAGFVLKLSRKGWICKTWEGEMQLVAVPGAVPEKFFFSVRDDAVVSQINAVLGKQVSAHYKQHIGVPSNCFGETQYYVDGVTEILPTKAR
jgi:hypothetical protein